jgi:urease accessory protein
MIMATATATRIPTITIIRPGHTPMTDASALYKLLAWLSPGYPVGAYTYSHGLEQAVEAGLVTDAESAQGWIADIVELGTGLSDAVFLAAAYRAAAAGDTERLRAVAELAAAFAATRELALESHAQGAAFLEITEKAWDTPVLGALRAVWPGPYANPVVVGCAAAGHGIALRETAVAYLHAFAANLVSAAVRLVPLGQTDGQRITTALESTVERAAARALETDLEAAANAALMVDICSMKHETQHTRLFRS